MTSCSITRYEMMILRITDSSYTIQLKQNIFLHVHQTCWVYFVFAAYAAAPTSTLKANLNSLFEIFFALAPPTK